MSCKCDKDKFREMFRSELKVEESKHVNYFSTTNNYKDYGFMQGMRFAITMFDELWKEYMED